MNDPLAPDAGRSAMWKWWVCVLLLLATMIMYMDRLVLTQQEKLIREAFGIERDDLKYGLLDSAFAIAFAFGALLNGWLADRWSVWLLYPLAVTLWSLMGGITGLITGYWVLFTCRFFLGFFESGHWPCALKTTQRILSPSERTLGNSILQSGAAIGSVVTPLALLWLVGDSAPPPDTGARTVGLLASPLGQGPLLAASTAFAGKSGDTSNWRLPFVLVGALGLCWAVGWFWLVRRKDVDVEPPAAPSPGTSPEAGSTNASSWLEIYRDRRFWVMLAVVVCINCTWHFFRVWMPVILRQLHNFTPTEVQRFSIAYYVAADVGSLATGFFSVALVRRGFSVHFSRLTVFAMCAVMALLSLTAILAPGQPVFLWVLPVVAFASLGLFPPYYSFSQELTVRNQGKVTGSLGFICWIVIAGLNALQGLISNAVQARHGAVVDQYAFGITLAGIMPLVALVILVLCWRREQA